MRTIVFVCTGNTCRSPMAEAIARDAIDRGKVPGGEDLFVASAGLQASDGTPVAPETVHTLRAMGIEHRGTAKRLTAEMIRRADLILAMTAAHVAAAQELVASDPEQMAKIQALDPEGDIEDPIGQGQPAYDAVARRLQELLPGRLAGLLAPRTP